MHAREEQEKYGMKASFAARALRTLICFMRANVRPARLLHPAFVFFAAHCLAPSSRGIFIHLLGGLCK